MNQPSMADRKAPSPLELALLAGIVLLALVLRAFQLGAKSLWLDEVVLARSALGDGTLLGTFGFGGVVHPPGYLLLLRLLLLAGARADWLLRLPALLASLGGIVALWALGRSLLGRAAGLLAAFLLAISAFHIAYAQEVHSYALLATLSTVMLWGLQRAARAGGGWELQPAQPPGIGPRLRAWLHAWWPFVLASVLNLYLHYYAVFPVAVSVLIFPLLLLALSPSPPPASGNARRDQDAPARWRRPLLGLAVAVVIIALLYLPQLAFRLSSSAAYASQRTQAVQSGELAVRFQLGLHLVGEMLAGFATGAADVAGGWVILAAFTAVLALIGLAALALGNWGRSQPSSVGSGPPALSAEAPQAQPALEGQRSQGRLLALAFFLWLFLPLPVIAWLAQRAGESFAVRRLIFGLPVFLLLVAVGILACGGLVARFLHARVSRSTALGWGISALLVLALAAASVVPLAAYYQKPKQDWKALAAVLRQSAGPGDAVVALDSLTAANLGWYYQGQVQAVEPGAVAAFEAWCRSARQGSRPAGGLYVVGVPPVAAYPEDSAAWLARNTVEVPFYRLSLYFRNCHPEAWYGDGAEDLYRQALAQAHDPGPTERAFEEYARLLQEQPEDSRLAQGRSRAFLQAVELWPSDGLAHARLAAYLAQAQGGTAGVPEQATSHYRQAVQLAPDEPLVTVLYAAALERSGRRGQALAVVEERLGQLGPSSPGALGLEALAAALRGETPDADTTWLATVDTGRTALRVGNWDVARAAGEQAVAQAPERHQSYQLLAQVYQATGDLGPAREAFQEALARAPHLPELYLALAEIAYAQGQPEQAARLAWDAVALDSSSAPGWSLLAQAYAALAGTGDPSLSAMAQTLHELMERR